MRRKRVCLALTVVALILTWVLPAVAADNPFVIKSPPFKSAIIKYKYTGTQQGTATVYYKGDVQAEYKQVATKILGIGSEDNTIVITEPKRVTTIDLEKNEAYYTGNYMTYMAQEYEKLSPAEKKRVKKNAEKMAGNFMAAMGGSPQISQGTFMNRPVEIVKTMGLTSYTWKGKRVVLKQDGSIMGMDMNMAATDIKTGVPVPADKLQPPAGIKPVFNQKADDQQRKMAKQVMDMLKDPDFGKKQDQAMQKAAQQQREAQQQQQAGENTSGQGQSQDKTSEAVQEGLNAVKKIFNW
ncbi:MAG: hypothetical protein KQI62_10395 [Deltaproteobacteria bacterium]|nr:hypothetical protein [Deltaproteobacteria bacterium]